MTPEEKIAENAALVVAFRSGGIKAACAIIPRLTESGVWMRLRRLGEIKRRIRHRDWQTLEVNELIRMRTAGMSSREIAKALKRSKYSVDGQIRLLVSQGRLPTMRAIRRYTDAHRKFVDRSVDQLIDHIAFRLDRSSEAIRHELYRSLRGYSARHSAIATREIA